MVRRKNIYGRMKNEELITQLFTRLKNGGSDANLSGEGTRKLEIMEEIILLDKYTIPANPSSDGYYHVQVADSTKKNGRRQIKAKTIEDLETKLLNYEHSAVDGTARKTFKEVWEIEQSRKLSLTKNPEKKLSVQNSLSRRRQTYNRFIGDTKFEKMYIDEITPRQIENLYQANLDRYDLRRKATLDLRSALKTTFELAYRCGWTKDNPYTRCDFEQFKDMIIPDVKISERGYSDKEMENFFEEVHKRQDMNGPRWAAYALELQMLCGLRRGEVPPLRWEDCHDGYIDIHQSQLTVKSGAGKQRSELVHHTKTWKDRRFPITNRIKEFLGRLKDAQHKAGYFGEYLFPADNELGYISNAAVYQVYRRICNRISVSVNKEVVRGPHAFRRNGITDVVKKSNGNILMASQLYGNTPSIAEKNYYLGLDMDAARQLLEQ